MERRSALQSKGDERRTERMGTQASETSLAQPPFDHLVDGAIGEAGAGTQPSASCDMREDGGVVTRLLAGSSAGLEPLVDHSGDVRGQLHRAHDIALGTDCQCPITLARAEIAAT